jgi:hypothetical protein
MACRIERTNMIDGGGNEKFFYVVHPLDDAPEEKISLDQPMVMGRGVKVALYGLKAYLLLVVLLAVFRFLMITKLL